MKKFDIDNESAINLGSFFLRIACALMLVHGWKKLSNFSDMSSDFEDPLHLGSTFSLALTVFAEFFCTIFVVAGLFTRIALVPLIFSFIVIVFVVHAHDPFKEREAAIMYLLIYLATFYVGPGKYSLDNLLRKK